MSTLAELKVLEDTVVRKVRRLSLPGKVLVEQQQLVEPDTVIARTELLPGLPNVVNLLENIDMAPRDLKECIKVEVGQEVEKGDLLAEIRRNIVAGGTVTIKSPYSGVVEHVSYTYGQIIIREKALDLDQAVIVNVPEELGISPWLARMAIMVKTDMMVKQNHILAAINMDAVRSPVSGRVVNINWEQGIIVLEREQRPLEVNAYLQGRVEEIIPQEGAVIAARAAYIQGIFGVGNERFGNIQVVVDRPHEVLTPEQLSSDLRGSIIVGGAYITSEALWEAMRLGVSGIVVGGASMQDIVEVIGKEIGVAVTGHEDIDFSLMITEGFGRLPMNERTFRIFRSHQGRVASMNGSTQIRAGVLRPEVVIPLTEQDLIEGCEQSEPDSVARLAAGQRVRVYRQPYFGKTGTVVEAPKAQRRVETEAVLTTLKVQLDSGQVIEVSDTNVEVLR